MIGGPNSFDGNGSCIAARLRCIPMVPGGPKSGRRLHPVANKHPATREQSSIQFLRFDIGSAELIS